MPEYGYTFKPSPRTKKNRVSSPIMRTGEECPIRNWGRRVFFEKQPPANDTDMCRGWYIRTLYARTGRS